jgi:hypothetical protein
MKDTYTKHICPYCGDGMQEGGYCCGECHGEDVEFCEGCDCPVEECECPKSEPEFYHREGK